MRKNHCHYDGMLYSRLTHHWIKSVLMVIINPTMALTHLVKVDFLCGHYFNCLCNEFMTSDSSLMLRTWPLETDIAILYPFEIRPQLSAKVRTM